MHTAGVTLLVFRVLPFFGSMFALSILYATCVVPALFKLLFTKPQLNNQKNTGTTLIHNFSVHKSLKYVDIYFSSVSFQLVLNK